MTGTRILAFDTSGPHCAASLLINGDILASRHEEMQKGQAERLVPMLQEVLEAEGVVWDEIHAIAVGVGPGNFTGVRISVSAARGLALGLGIPSIGISIFEALRGPDWYGNREPQFVVGPSSRRGCDVVVQRFVDARAVGDIAEGALWQQTGDNFPRIVRPKHPHWVLGTHASAFNYAVQDDEGPVAEVSFTDRDRERLADRIALVAALKLAAGETTARPAPLYARSADAAPASDPPPVILP